MEMTVFCCLCSPRGCSVRWGGPLGSEGLTLELENVLTIGRGVRHVTVSCHDTVSKLSLSVMSMYHSQTTFYQHLMAMIYSDMNLGLTQISKFVCVYMQLGRLSKTCDDSQPTLTKTSKYKLSGSTVKLCSLHSAMEQRGLTRLCCPLVSTLSILKTHFNILNVSAILHSTRMHLELIWKTDDMEIKHWKKRFYLCLNLVKISCRWIRNKVISYCTWEDTEGKKSNLKYRLWYFLV